MAEASLTTELEADGSTLEPRTDPTRLYVLTCNVAAETKAASLAPGGGVEPSIGLGPVDLAAYLARPELVRRGSGHEVAASAVERWGEPLERRRDAETSRGDRRQAPESRRRRRRDRDERGARGTGAQDRGACRAVEGAAGFLTGIPVQSRSFRFRRSETRQ